MGAGTLSPVIAEDLGVDAELMDERLDKIR
jgi:hypothetical protein